MNGVRDSFEESVKEQVREARCNVGTEEEGRVLSQEHTKEQEDAEALAALRSFQKGK